MATSNYGLLQGLATKLPDRSKYAFAQIQANAKAEAAKQKADAALMDDLQKFVINDSKDINPVHQSDAADVSRNLIADYVKGKRTDPNYEYSEPFMQAKNQFHAAMNNYRYSSDNIDKTLQMQMAHPDDYEMPQELKSALLNGDSKAYKAYMLQNKGGQPGYDMFTLGYQLTPKMNEKKIADVVTKAATVGEQPTYTKVQTLPNGHIAYQVATPVNQQKLDAAISQMWATEPYGTKDVNEYKAKILPFIPDAVDKAPYVEPPRSNTGNGYDGNKSGSVNVKSTTLSDGSIRHDIKDNTSTNDTKILIVSSVTDPTTNKPTGEIGIKDPTPIEKNGNMFITGQKMKLTKGVDAQGNPVNKWEDTGQPYTRKLTKDDVGLELANRFSNTYSNVPNLSIDENGNWRFGVNKNINLRNYDTSGLKAVATPKAAAVVVNPKHLKPIKGL